jgi:RNA polymerase sigma factor for flagellar operon FliA
VTKTKAQNAEELSTPGSDGAARDEALIALYPIVSRIAHRAAATYGLPPGVEPCDLVSCGVIGLAELWVRFDPKRGVPFQAYAIPRVKGAVIDAIRASDWVPRKARQRARLTGEPVSALVSIDGDRSRGSNERSHADRLSDSSVPEPGDDLMEAARRTELLGLLRGLPEREQTIISMHYFEGLLLQDIARSLGVTPSRISQVHNRALRKLRSALHAIDASTAA